MDTGYIMGTVHLYQSVSQWLSVNMTQANTIANVCLLIATRWYLPTSQMTSVERSTVWQLLTWLFVKCTIVGSSVKYASRGNGASDVTRVSDLKQTICSVFFKHDEQDPNINNYKGRTPTQQKTGPASGCDKRHWSTKLTTIYVAHTVTTMILTVATHLQTLQYMIQNFNTVHILDVSRVSPALKFYTFVILARSVNYTMEGRSCRAWSERIVTEFT